MSKPKLIVLAGFGCVAVTLCCWLLMRGHGRPSSSLGGSESSVPTRTEPLRLNLGKTERPFKTDTVVSQDVLRVASQLRSASASDRMTVLREMRELARTKPSILADRLQYWLQSLLDAHEDKALLELTAVALRAKPHNMSLVIEGQRARVMANLALGNKEAALCDAKSYFNVASLKLTPDAVEVVTDVMLASPDPVTQALAAKFADDLVAQSESGASPAQCVLQSIAVDQSAYAELIEELQARKPTYGRLLGLGNLMLLAGRASEARTCFADAWQYAEAKDSQRRILVESFARAAKCEQGNPYAANELILTLRGADPATCKDLGIFGSADEVKRVADTITLFPRIVIDEKRTLAAEPKARH